MTIDPCLYPFAGIRVADFSWVVAGPMTTQYLAVHGADVIRIESRGRPDVLRAGQPMIGGTGPDHTAYFADYNQGKRGITLNLRHPRAVDLAKRLVAACDIVAENYSPGTMEKLGLGYEALRAVRPDVIMISMALAGQTGPERGYKGFGTVIQGAAGISDLTGWPDRPPAGTGVAYTDFFAAQVAAFAVMAALDARQRTGRGQYIDLSQQEASLYALDAALLDYTVNGHMQSRQGNRHPSAAPHGAFPCRPHAHIAAPAGGGEVVQQGWLAIAVYSDADWRALRAALGQAAWACDERFATLLGRKQHEDELERLLSAWTAAHTAPEAADHLRSFGVPVSVVASAADLYADPQLQHRGHFLHLGHPAVGDFPFDALAHRLDGAVPLPPRPGPLLGGDTRAVLTDLLGLGPEEYQELEAEGALN